MIYKSISLDSRTHYLTIIYCTLIRILIPLFYIFCIALLQPRSQGFSLFVIGKAGKGPGTGRSHDFQHPDIVGVINYNN